MSRIRTAPRLPRSGNAALAAGALIQAALGAVFLLAGLGKVVAPDYPRQFRDFVQGSAGASDGPLASLVPDELVVPHLDVVAQLKTATSPSCSPAPCWWWRAPSEVARPDALAGPLGARHGY